MCQVEFQYNGKKEIIKCNENEKMRDICYRFKLKAKIEKNDIYFSYNGKAGSEFNEELTFYEITNSFDKKRKYMSILVYDINENKINN